MLNHVTLMGRICNDIELRRTGSGIPVASFTLAVDRDFKNANGEKETDFFECVAWRNTAEFVQKYFGKGKMAALSGRLQIRSWTDKEGRKCKSAEVVVENIYFGESKSADKPAENFGNFNMPAQNFDPIDEPDFGLPF